MVMDLRIDFWEDTGCSKIFVPRLCGYFGDLNYLDFDADACHIISYH